MPVPCRHDLAILVPGLDRSLDRRVCARCAQPTDVRLRVTFDIVTPESAEDGDIAEAGWIDEEGRVFDASDTDDDQPSIGAAVGRAIARAAGAVECSDSSHEVTRDRSPWFTQADPTIDFRTGEEERHAYHVSGLTADEWRDLFAELGLRPGPVAAVDHGCDRDCQPYLSPDGTCAACGVAHGDPCPACGGRGFHAPGCAAVD